MAKAKRDIKNHKKRNLIVLGLSIILIIIVFLAIFYFNNKSKNYKESIEDSKKQNNTILVNEEVKECVEDWNCENWSSCINGNQTRVCNDKNNCNTTKNKPEEKKDCCFWDCAEWSECLASNISFRKCILPKDCVVKEEKPETRVNCTYENPCTDEEGEIDYGRNEKVIDKNGAEWYDTCLDDNTLSEVHCDTDGDTIWKEYTCNSTCEDGECS